MNYVDKFAVGRDLNDTNNCVYSRAVKRELCERRDDRNELELIICHVSLDKREHAKVRGFVKT